MTNIIREYIENRYDVQALEFTTDEIIAGLEEADLNPHEINDLKEILTSADYVKFAKAKPLAELHIDFFNRSKDFVLKTKKKEQILESDKVDNPS